MSMAYKPGIKFDKLQWLANKEERFLMADSIISSRMLIGKDTSQVKEILGEPTFGSDSTWQSNRVNTWSYAMGIGGFIGFTFHDLIITFEKENVVAVEHQEIND